MDEWEVDRRDVTVKEVLGEGAFGTVHLGTLLQDSAFIEVAIKVCLINELQPVCSVQAVACLFCSASCNWLQRGGENPVSQ